MTDIFSTTWHDFPAFALESLSMRAVIVPELGAKIVSLIDKTQMHEWLIPPQRPLKRVQYGADFEKQDMSGWDEMFPTIVACDYPGSGNKHGVPLPDHGEVWTLPWEVERASSGKLILSVDGPVLPYHLTRTMQWTEPTSLQLSYQLVNLGQEPMPYLWAAHPQFVCNPGTAVIFPPQVKAVCNSLPESWGWGSEETRFDWPEALASNGRRMRIDRIGLPALHLARKFFVLPEVRVGWAGLVRRSSNDWLCMDWDSDRVPYLGLWVDEGAISSESVAAPEPMTGFYDSLAAAWDKKRVAVVDPGASQSWRLTVRFGEGEQLSPA